MSHHFGTSHHTDHDQDRAPWWAGEYRDHPAAAEEPGDAEFGYRNPSFEWRVALVGAVMSLPGTLTGLLACVFLGSPGQAEGFIIAGALGGAILGAVLEGRA